MLSSYGSNFVGKHVVTNYSSCDLAHYCQNREEASKIAEIWIKFLLDIGVTTLGSHVHFFTSNALSISLNLSESHLNFHTWPEHGYVALDFFCCKKSTNLRQEMEGVLEQGKKHFRSDAIESIWIDRGFEVT